VCVLLKSGLLSCVIVSPLGRRRVTLFIVLRARVLSLVLRGGESQSDGRTTDSKKLGRPAQDKDYIEQAGEAHGLTQGHMDDVRAHKTA
jgi:hypothetical protein